MYYPLNFSESNKKMQPENSGNKLIESNDLSQDSEHSSGERSSELIPVRYKGRSRVPLYIYINEEGNIQKSIVQVSDSSAENSKNMGSGDESVSISLIPQKNNQASSVNKIETLSLIDQPILKESIISKVIDSDDLEKNINSNAQFDKKDNLLSPLKDLILESKIVEESAEFSSDSRVTSSNSYSMIVPITSINNTMINKESK